MIWKCPVCNTENASYDERCDCGFELASIDSDSGHKAADTTGRSAITKEVTPVTYDNSVSVIRALSGLLSILLAVSVFYIFDQKISHTTNDNFFLGALCFSIFIIYKLSYNAFIDLNLIRLKSISFAGNTISFKYRNETILFKKILKVKNKWSKINVLGETDKGAHVEIKVPKRFIRKRKDRRVFLEMLGAYK